VTRKPNPNRESRDKWIRHFASCEYCKATKDGVCDEGRPLLAAALVEMGEEKK
jgi:hypothetical protein